MSQKISEMQKIPTLTGGTKIPTGTPGPGGNYYTDPDQILALSDFDDFNIDGGRADTIFVAGMNIDGGNAAG